MLKSPFTQRKPRDFRVLLLYPNLQMYALMPQVIGIFSAILKKEGYTQDIFDCTYYQDIDEINFGKDGNKKFAQEERVKNRGAAPHDNKEWAEKAGKPKIGIKKDFIKKVQDFKPDLILVSVLESTYFLANELLSCVPEKDRKYKTLFGGVFATYGADKLIKNNVVDYICRGEGEDALVEMCRKLCSGDRIDNVLNFTIKGNGQIYRNRLRAAVDINSIPIPDWDLFDPGSVYRPMQGNIYRVVGVETQRGCPYTCTFCNSPSNNVIYKEEANRIFHRKKTIKRVREELDFLVKKYDPELIYFVVDTFLAMSNREFDEFKEMYMDYKIPFWMNTRAETITEHRAAGLEEMNMLRMDIGVEHGNPEYRKTYLKRNVSDEVQIKAFEMVADKKYTSSANCIIGMPDENRELIFDTIKFLRKLPPTIETKGAFIFSPFHGLPLRDLAIQKGYLNDDEIVSSFYTHSILNMPSISSEEISGLARTFSYYVKFPESRWDEIKIAEQFTPEGETMHAKLGIEFDDKYRLKKPTMPDLH